MRFWMKEAAAERYERTERAAAAEEDPNVEAILPWAAARRAYGQQPGSYDA